MDAAWEHLLLPMEMEAVGVLTGENVLVTVLALVLWPLPFQPLMQVLHLLLLQTLRGERGKWSISPQEGCLRVDITWGRSALAE